MRDVDAREKLRLAAATARKERDARRALVGEPVQQPRWARKTAAPSTWLISAPEDAAETEDEDDLT